MRAGEMMSLVQLAGEAGIVLRSPPLAEMHRVFECPAKRRPTRDAPVWADAGAFPLFLRSGTGSECVCALSVGEDTT